MYCLWLCHIEDNATKAIRSPKARLIMASGESDAGLEAWVWVIEGGEVGILGILDLWYRAI